MSMVSRINTLFMEPSHIRSEPCFNELGKLLKSYYFNSDVLQHAHELLESKVTI